MILSIGEILTDMISQKKDGATAFIPNVGGAPFNFAVNAARCGARVGFVGRVGDDVFGNFLIERAEKAGLNYLDVQVDDERNTTVAFITLDGGERDFSFYRHDTADYNVDFDAIDFSKYTDLTFVHLGSLMLSKESGRTLALNVADKAAALNVKLSFDVNYRADLYNSVDEAKSAYAPIIERADVLKFSLDELLAFTGKSDLFGAAAEMQKKDKLLVVSLGSNGSAYFYNGQSGVIPPKKVEAPIDTTGAGDAFFGAFIAAIENRQWTKESIEYALDLANCRGAEATQFFGAIQI